MTRLLPLLINNNLSVIISYNINITIYHICSKDGKVILSSAYNSLGQHLKGRFISHNTELSTYKIYNDLGFTLRDINKILISDIDSVQTNRTIILKILSILRS